MIFITLGTQACDFSRCMRMVEELVNVYKIEEPIIAQIGHTSYRPAGITCFDFVSEQQYLEYISAARVVISHAGTGALFSSIKRKKTVIAVARLKKYGEMVNDHQTEIVKKLADGGYILDGTNSIIDVWNKLPDFTPRECDFKNELPQAIGNLIDSWIGRSQ